MPRIESLCREIWNDTDFRTKWLVGGLLGSIPLLNLLLGGYFLRYVRQLRAGDGLTLPAWDDWQGLLMDAVRMAIILFLFAGVPALVGWILSALLALSLGAIYLAVFSVSLAWVFFAAGLALGMPLSVAALQRYLPSQDWSRVFDLPAVWRVTRRMGPQMVLPTLALWGLFALGMPLMGFAFFLGFGPYLAYGTAVYLSRDAGPVA